MTLREHRRLPGQIARYSLNARGSIRYLGWLGQRNLGDEATYEATAACFTRRLAWRPDAYPDHLDRVVKARAGLLGGGTIVGGRYLSTALSTSPASRLAVFGSGVVDPEFPHSFADGTELLERWYEALQDFALVGVRGPRSQAILSEGGIKSEILGDPIAQYAQSTPRFNPDGPLGINVGHSFGRTWGSEYRFLGEMVSAIELLKRQGRAIEYLVVWPGDLETTRKIAKQSGTAEAPIHTVYEHASDARTVMTRWSAVAAMKLHAAALGVCFGLPTVSLEYHPKCRDFMSSVGLDDQVIRLDRVTAPVLTEALHEATDAARSLEALHQLQGFASLQRDRAAGFERLLESD